MSKSRRTIRILVVVVSVVLLGTIPLAYSSVDLPEYDSGWVTLAAGEKTEPGILPPLHPSETIFTHNLGTKDVFVYVTAKTSESWIVPFETYGREFAESRPDPLESWFLISENEIMLRNYFEYEIEVRIRIWKIVKAQPPVGGFVLPIDIRLVFAPWIVLISTITLAASALVVYIKYKKRQ